MYRLFRVFFHGYMVLKILSMDLEYRHREIHIYKPLTKSSEYFPLHMYMPLALAYRCCTLAENASGRGCAYRFRNETIAVAIITFPLNTNHELDGIVLGVADITIEAM